MAPAQADDCATLSGNLVSNCGFETGDFTGWTQGGNTAFTGVASGNYGGVDPTQGTFQAFFGPVGSPGSISQTLATVAGAWYTLSFGIAYGSGGGGGQGDTTRQDVIATSAEVIWDSNSTLALLDGGPFAYTPYSIQVQASGSSTLLQFQFRNDPSYFELDNIAVVASAVPSPEPSSMAIMAVSLGFIALRRRRRA